MTDNIEIKKQNIMERVRTFEDACNVLGDNNPLVVEWNFLKDIVKAGDVIAYLKMRIITTALNECWEPQFVEDEYRYYPYFELLTQEEIDNLLEKDKARVIARPNHHANANGGVAGADAYGVAAGASAFCCSPLAFRTRELAEYTSLQFADIWADFFFNVREPTTMSDE